jgi:N-acetylneuraminate synthase
VISDKGEFGKALKAGDLFTNGAIRSVRPGFGLAPKYLDEVVGHYLDGGAVFGTAATLNHLKGR